MKDVFISYSSKDKISFINPIINELKKNGITFWLDEVEMTWGDSLSLKINEGLKKSKFALVCLSKNYLNSNWTKAELNAMLSLQYSNGLKKVLPLILDSKNFVLKEMPLIAGTIYKTFSGADLSNFGINLKQQLVNYPNSKDFVIKVEGFDSGIIHKFTFNESSNIKFVIHEIKNELGLKDQLSYGGNDPFQIRFTLIDKGIIDKWEKLPRSNKQELFVLFKDAQNNLKECRNERERIETLGILNNRVFYICPIEKIKYGGREIPPGGWR